MSGYKRMRKDHQASLARLEEQCRQEMEKHKQLLDREYEQLLGQFSRELEKLQLRHQEDLGKRVRQNLWGLRININSKTRHIGQTSIYVTSFSSISY